MPVLIAMGFNDKIIPYPQKISYPTLLEIPNPILFGYTLETAFAEKLESIVKLASVNTRMKDFYDIWTMVRNHHMDLVRLKNAINEVFSNRGMALEYPAAFKPTFYDLHETKQRWKKFLIDDMSNFLNLILFTPLHHDLDHSNWETTSEITLSYIRKPIPNFQAKISLEEEFSDLNTYEDRLQYQLQQNNFFPRWWICKIQG